MASSALIKTRAAAPRRSVVLTPYLLLLPALVFFVLPFVLPIINLFTISIFSSGRMQTSFSEFTLANYAKFVTDPFYLGILGRTFKLAFITTLVCTVLGYPLAFAMVRSSGRRLAYMTLILLAPLLVSVIARNYGWVVVLSPNGLINGILRGLGIVDEPIRLLFTETAIIIGLTQIFLAYSTLSMFTVLRNIDPDLYRAAANLGADKLSVFLRVILPLSLPGIVAASAIVFTLSTSAFLTPAVLGGPFVKVMTALIRQQAAGTLDWAFAASLSYILLFVTAAVVVFYLKAVEGKFEAVFR